jgi:hypothetical protein
MAAAATPPGHNVATWHPKESNTDDAIRAKVVSGVSLHLLTNLVICLEHIRRHKYMPISTIMVVVPHNAPGALR